MTRDGFELWHVICHACGVDYHQEVPAYRWGILSLIPKCGQCGSKDIVVFQDGKA